MRRATPPFRADHVGSLLRPERLLRAREGFAAGRLPAQDLRAVGDDAIAGAVRMQEGNALSYDEEVAKLRLIVDLARDVWGD
jgi:5-methyltetrahydropteroyltriglutamate--homocysteine methyltransferase